MREAMQGLFGHTQLSPCLHMHWGEPCRGLDVAPASAHVVVPNSQQISCLDGSFLECSLPTREARVDPRPGRVSPGTSRRG